jgi:hypothetical protein
MIIRAGLGGMGYSRRLYKKDNSKLQIYNILISNQNFKNKHFTSCNVSKCLYGS